MRRLTIAPACAAALAVAAAIVVACAQPGSPPGGPPDFTAPQLVAVSPESGSTNPRPGEVTFQFNEVISERPTGAPDLRGIVVISPRDGDPDVRWHRTSLGIKPGRGWRANTVYTISLLPGIADLRGNARKVGTTIAFSTGGPFPETQISGIVFDWVAQKPAPRALVEAINAADSTTYVAAADSSGRFSMVFLRPGTYGVRAIVDQNNNRRREAREPWDSVTVTLRDTSTLELLATAHDTAGPRIATVTVRDSLTLRIALDQPLASSVRIDSSLIQLRRSDSTVVPIASVLSSAAFEDLERATQAARADSVRRADSTRAARDTTPRAPRNIAVVPTPTRDSVPAAEQPKPSRPAPVTELVVRLARPLAPATAYRVRLVAAQGLIGLPRTTDRVFTTVKPAAPRDSAATRRSGARPDTTARDTSARKPPR